MNRNLKNQSERSKSSIISHDQFFEHFENLYSNSNGFSSDGAEEDISNIDDNINVEELDCDFTIEEVKKAISARKYDRGSFDSHAKSTYYASTG